jgi:predicted O-methyltransferase YrrM
MENYLMELMNRTLKTKNDGGLQYFEHVLTFFSIALQMKTKKILELGVRDGGSSYPFLVASKVLGGHVTSVDINSDVWRPPEDLAQYQTFIQSDAIDFLINNTEKYDLIYVDDWHSYPHVKKELEEIDRVSDENTIILLHDLMGNSEPNYWSPIDYDENGEWGLGGPYRAVEELDKEKWEWMTIPTNHGLTILRKKGKVITNLIL